MASLVWFREDLRCQDHSALYAAWRAKAAMIGVYIFDPSAWQAHDTAPARIDFMLRNLAALQHRLAKLGIPLLLLEVTTSADIAPLLVALADAVNADALYFNDQYEWNEAKRDQAVVLAWQRAGKPVYRFTDQVLFQPGELRTQAGQAFKVFSPYKKAFWHAFHQRRLELCALSAIKRQAEPTLPATLNEAVSAYGRWHETVPTAWPGLEAADVSRYWPGGEAAAQRRLQTFIASKIGRYHLDRDTPALHGTSALSPYLANGVLSPRQVFHAALAASHDPATTMGAETWLNELVWREFYKHVLWAFPRVSQHRAFNPATERIVWREDPALFAAWSQGQTGFPLVDAAMRQLKKTGWMHNRLRMVVAMFLSKDCFIDWRLGERYFMQHLVDGDLAANNGGWQWCASTGTDAAPYFRIFNPVAQSQKFDPEGEFIKHYCPELAALSAKEIHAPWLLSASRRQHLAYPEPIVDRSQTRARVIQAFRHLSVP